MSGGRLSLFKVGGSNSEELDRITGAHSGDGISSVDRSFEFSSILDNLDDIGDRLDIQDSSKTRNDVFTEPTGGRDDAGVTILLDKALSDASNGVTVGVFERRIFSHNNVSDARRVLNSYDLSCRVISMD